MLDGTQFLLEIHVERGSCHLFLYHREIGHPNKEGEKSGMMDWRDQTDQRDFIMMKVLKPLVNSIRCVK